MGPLEALLAGLSGTVSFREIERLAGFFHEEDALVFAVLPLLDADVFQVHCLTG